MASTSETVIAAVQALVARTLTAFVVERNAEGPDSVPNDGWAIIRDGEPGTPEVTLSPLSYTYQHAVRVEVIVMGATPKQRAERLDEALIALGMAIEADRSLGGLCDWLAPSDEPPAKEDFHVEGGDTGRIADLDIIAVYSTPNPLT